MKVLKYNKIIQHFDWILVDLNRKNTSNEINMKTKEEDISNGFI